jgi:hypothetical protein
VGVIAVIGFTVGVVWPRLAGIRPGPSAPGESTASAGTASSRAPEPPAASVAGSASEPEGSAAASGSAAAEAPVPLNNAPPAILASHGVVMSCKTTDGDSIKGATQCGTLSGFDALAQPRFKRLAHCPGAQGISGKLGTYFTLDFVRNKISLGFTKATIPNKDTIEGCLRMSFENVSLNAVAHDNPLYGVYYAVTFTPRDSVAASIPAPSSAESDAPAATAEVAWEVAIVRDSPRTGQVVGRLQRGTKVHVGAGQDGWFRVQFGNDFASDGWVYRGAIGR